MQAEPAASSSPLRGGRRLARAAAIVAVLLAVACAWLPAIQQAAYAQVDAGLKRALIAFAAARTLNAAISVAQGTQVALQPAGVGVTLSLGEVLDPVNDLVEQFSSLMLVAAVAFGVQKVLLAVGAHWAVSLAVTVAALGWGLAYWHGRAPPWLARAVVVLVAVRFALPVATLGSDWVFQRFLADDYRQAQSALDALSAQVERGTAAAAAEPKEQGLLDRIKRWGDEKTAEWRGRVDELRQAAERAAEHLVRLIVVFVLQTIVLPLALMWGVVKLAAAACRPRAVQSSVSP
jgi:hypothetical protein